MTVSLLDAQATCPAPKPPPPPKPPKFDARLQRAIEVACQAPPFPSEVIETLRGLLAPHARRSPERGNPDTNPHPTGPRPDSPPPPRLKPSGDPRDTDNPQPAGPPPPGF